MEGGFQVPVTAWICQIKTGPYLLEYGL